MTPEPDEPREPWPLPAGFGTHERQRASDRVARILVGFVCVGGLLAAFSAARFVTETSGPIASPWIAAELRIALALLAVAAATFFLICILLRSPRRRRAAAARRRLAAGVPPRLADVPPGEEPPTSGRGVVLPGTARNGVAAGTFAVLLGVGLVAFAGLAVRESIGAVLVALGLAIWAFRVAWRCFRAKLQGELEADWSGHPPGQGGVVRVRVAVARGGSSVEGLRFGLRAIRSEWPPFDVPQVLRQFRPAPGAPDACGPDEWVEVVFRLPSHAPSTDLSVDRPVHWEFLARGEGTWGAVLFVTCIPVYLDAAPEGR